MAPVYEIRIWNNGDVMDVGTMDIYRMSEDPSEVADEVNYTDAATLHFRLLESITNNLASIAESLDHIRVKMDS